jgi:hypothetical protein
MVRVRDYLVPGIVVVDFGGVSEVAFAKDGVALDDGVARWGV